MVNTITFFDPLIEEGQVWLVDSKGIPTKPERLTNKPFYIYKLDGKYRGISYDTFEMLKAVFKELSKKK